MPQDTSSSPPNFFPELVYDDTRAALDWLSRAFGFVKGVVIEGADGTIDHAEMHMGAGTIMLEGPLPETEYRLKSPRALGGASQMIYVTVADPDAHHAQAKAAGAQIIMEPWDTEYGARNYTARDLEGHLWGFGTYTPGVSGA